MFHLFLIMVSFADIGPRPKCPDGTYRTYTYKSICLDNEYTMIALRKYKLSREDSEKLNSGEIVIPDVDMSGMDFGGSHLKIKKEDSGKVLEFLKYFGKTEKEKGLLKIREQKMQERKEKKKEKEALERLQYSEDEEKEEEIVTSDEEKSCAKVSISQSFFLVLWAIVFSGLRRRA